MSLHRLFFALRPPADVVPAIVAMRDRDGTGHGRVEDHRLHLTTYLFDDHARLPIDLVDRARRAADGVRRRPIHLNLDRLTGDDRGLRLVPSEPIRGFVAFQRDLALAMTRAGLAARAGWRFSPHLTLRYGGRQSIDEAILGISWLAGELVLIDSVFGEHRHETLARWPLTAT